MNNLTLRQKKQIVLSVFVIILVIVFASITSYYTNQKGKVGINYTNLVSTSNVKTTFNGKTLKPVSGSLYQLHRGNYTLLITKPNYKKLSVPFTIKTGQTLTIEAALQPIHPPPALTANQLSIGSVADSQAQITNIQYFYNNQWAVVNIQIPNTDPGVLVANYSFESGHWDVILGPGTFFPASDTQNLPTSVSSYLQTNNYVDNGGGP